MNIIVFGVTGGTGLEFVRQALEEDHWVTAFVRDVSRLNIIHPHLRVVQGNALDREAVIHAVAGHDAVVSCLGAKQGGRPSFLDHPRAADMLAESGLDGGPASPVGERPFDGEIPDCT